MKRQRYCTIDQTKYILFSSLLVDYNLYVTKKIKVIRVKSRYPLSIALKKH